LHLDFTLNPKERATELVARSQSAQPNAPKQSGLPANVTVEGLGRATWLSTIANEDAARRKQPDALIGHLTLHAGSYLHCNGLLEKLLPEDSDQKYLEDYTLVIDFRTTPEQFDVEPVVAPDHVWPSAFSKSSGAAMQLGGAPEFVPLFACMPTGDEKEDALVGVAPVALHRVGVFGVLGSFAGSYTFWRWNRLVITVRRAMEVVLSAASTCLLSRLYCVVTLFTPALRRCTWTVACNIQSREKVVPLHCVWVHQLCCLDAPMHRQPAVECLCE
jgi:hypothetical protein